MIHGSTHPGREHGSELGLAYSASTLIRMSSITEITVHGGGRHRVEGNIKDVERLVLNAARGSIMEFAWFTDAQTGEALGVNPAAVVMLRADSGAE